MLGAAITGRISSRLVPNEIPILTPLPAALEPELISDGGGLPFHPAAPYEQHPPLDPAEPSVKALLGQIEIGRKQARRRGFFRREPAPAPMDEAQKLAGWRPLAATEDEVLYAKGRPPQMLTVAVKRGRGEHWSVVGVSNSRPLRAIREGTRASSWRPDPDFPLDPEQTEVHLLVTEQTMATGRMAEDRMLAPDVFIDAERVVLRLYVKALEGYVGRTRRHETPVVVRLAEPIGERTLIDGALYEARS